MKNGRFLRFLITTIILALATIIALDSRVHAKIDPEDVIVALGEDLTIAQRDAILEEMGIQDTDEITITTVSNSDEHKYLGDYIPAAQIGSNAISSAIIRMGSSNDGLSIQLNNINYITEKMYGNALTTAGVKDAEIYITAPFSVSGTGALTGIMQAYEITSGTEIDEDIKQVANEEMVLTSDLSENETIGIDEAADFISLIKEEMSNLDLTTADEIRELIERLAEEQGFELTADELSKLVDLFNKFKELNIDWDIVSQKINEATDFFKTEEGGKFLESVKSFFVAIWDFLSSFFIGGENSDANLVEDENDADTADNVDTNQNTNQSEEQNEVEDETNEVEDNASDEDKHVEENEGTSNEDLVIEEEQVGENEDASNEDPAIVEEEMSSYEDESR